MPPSVRHIYRHESGQGSVIEFDYWGTKKKLFVADAKYRTSAPYDSSPKSHGNPQLAVTSDQFNGSADDNKVALTYTKDDAWIQSTYPELKSDGTAKSNTDFLMKFDTTKAAHFARQQNIAGLGALDLPNLYQLIAMYLESDNIDLLDPTVNSYRDFGLGMNVTHGRFYADERRCFRSSTERSSGYVQYVNYNGRAANTQQYTICGVAPVKEL